MNEPHPLQGSVSCGRYRIKRLIGRGGMAAVYEVEHETLGRRFALKSLLLPGGAATARLEREARALAGLDHPHIVAPVDFGVEGGAPYLVMELVAGETLAARLARVGRLDLGEIAAIFVPVCSALAAAHAIGVVHRDLKPSNVALSTGPGGRLVPKVLDFGVAKWLDAPDATLTGTGVLGTVSYLSPEVARGERSVDERTDVYSLGVMLFECATGELPFPGESSYEIMHRIVTGTRQAPTSIVKSLPPAFDALVEGALAREREDRLPSTQALGRGLLAFADGPTRALWEPALGGEGLVTGARGLRPPELDATLTEDHLAVIGGPRSTRPPSHGARRKTVVLLGAGAVALAALGGLSLAVRLSSAPGRIGDPVVAPAPLPPAPSSAPVADAVPSTTPAATVPGPPVAPTPAPLPAPLVAPRATSRSPHPPPAAQPPAAQQTSARPIETGRNGAVILE
jgi:serine/threonine-protein kinase